MSVSADDKLAVTKPMLKAGRAALVRFLGGQTEGDNRFVDYDEMAEAIFTAMSLAKLRRR